MTTVVERYTRKCKCGSEIGMFMRCIVQMQGSMTYTTKGIPCPTECKQCNTEVTYSIIPSEEHDVLMEAFQLFHDSTKEFEYNILDLYQEFYAMRNEHFVACEQK